MIKKVDKNTFFSEKRVFGYNGKTLDFTVPRVMGIVNVTPDSFYDLKIGRFGDLEIGRFGDLEIGRLGDLEIGRLDDLEIGRLDDLEIGRLDDLEIGRLDDWEIGRLDDLEIGRVGDLTNERFEDWMNGRLDGLLNRVEKMIIDGAYIIDIGAVSTRPGAAEVDSEEEKRRLMPVLKEIRRRFPEIIISIDTFRAEVAKMAAGEGAEMINDISGGTFDPDMIATIAQLNIPYVIMHIQGTPATMQLNPVYKDVVKEVKDFLLKQAKKLENIGHGKIILDPGFGFGKTVEHNYSLLSHLDEFSGTGYPVLAGLSRKSMINKVLGTKPDEALNGTTVLNTIALMKGAGILRVHDVKEAMEAVKLASRYLSA